MYRVANNCGQHSLDKNSYFIPSFSCFTSMIGSMKGLWIFWVKYQKDEHCIFILLIFIKGANISGGHCSFTYSQPLICRSPGLSLALSSLFCLSKTCLLLTSFCNIGSLLFHYWHILSLSFPPLVPYVHFRWLPFLWLTLQVQLSFSFRDAPTAEPTLNYTQQSHSILCASPILNKDVHFICACVFKSISTEIMSILCKANY